MNSANVDYSDKLFESAKDILAKNWNGRFTIASPTLYPHQWSWDSCFIAIGKSYYDTDQAMKEMESLFRAQWKNGMIPHIVFDESKKTYFPAADFYDTIRSENAPTDIGTSGMTQPPVHSIACYYVYENAKDKSRAKDFLQKIYPNLMAFHRYLTTDRDPEKSGLVTILHPWESGLDNSPTWDEPLSRIHIPEQDLPRVKRLDIIAVKGEVITRSSQWMYLRFIYLIQLMKKFRYDEKEMYQHIPFKVKDVLFNSIFYVANKFLIRIANIIGEGRGENKDTKEIKRWIHMTEQNFYKYFFPFHQQHQHHQQRKRRRMGSDEESLFYDYDLNKKDWIKRKTVSSLIPIYTGFIPKKDAELILGWTTHAHFCGEDGHCHVAAIPSTDMEVKYFKPMTYWRGPVWINTNWMIWLGMLKYGFTKEAELIKCGVFELTKNHGFREYYDPFDGRGLGGQDFSWSAALLIDMIMNKGIGIAPDYNR